MSDMILRAYSLILSIQKNIPDNYQVSDRWTKEYHSALDKVERYIGSKLEEFRITQSDIKKSIGSSNSITGEVRYRDGLWCERTILLQKVEAVLTYLQFLLKPEDRKIGF